MTNSTTDISAMKKLMQTYIFNLIAAVALLSGMASCTDDTDMPQAIDDGTTSITLRIPNPESAAEFARSRAATGDPDPSQNAEEGEGTIKSLWLLAYPTDGTESVVRKLLSSGQVTNEYSDYKITIKPGDYRLYVVANLDSYIADPISATTDEEELKSLVLNFSPEKLPNLTDGLPMACLPSEIDEAGDDGTIAIAPGDNVTVHADMTFLCAKVRYTIMFDNSADGFSRPAFGDNMIDDFKSVEINGVIASTSLLTPTTTSTEGAFPTTGQISRKSVTPHKPSWQGITYLPENLLSGKNRTSLHLETRIDGEGVRLSYTIPLPSPDADKETEEAKASLKRGHFYDLTGRITTLGDKLDLTAEVKDWTLLTLTYDLHGPYFLHVEKTAVEIYAGIETLIPYDTDAGQLTFTSEKYPDPVKDPGVTIPGGPLDLLECKTEERDGKKYIVVNVNPAIPAENRQLENRYFDIHAANLTKRINATIVSLKPFFNVSPTEIEVNIREYITSGEYEAEIPIVFSTNLNKVTITGDDSFCGSMSLEGDKTYTGAKEGKNILKITGLNGGADWTETKTFTLTYTATDGKTTQSIPVKITVKPNILNYIIHFRAPDWTRPPHIYVYQCLQLPADLQDKDGTPYSNRRGKTVGQDQDHAALEYAFSSKIAFKGWKGYGGPDINDPYAGGSFLKSFFVFWSNDYNASEENSNQRYFKDMDLSAEHRKDISTCEHCKNGNNELYPGICMIPEGGGWWKYTLSGIATPGKALIMFGNGHTFDEVGSSRYPGADEVGIPLFDYPNREGWFDYANGKTQFTHTKPEKEMFVLRIYWYDNHTETASYLHVWTTNPNWEGTKYATNTGYKDQESGYYYYDFMLQSSWSEDTEINAMMYKNNTAKGTYTISQFTDIGNNIRAITINSDYSLENSGTPPKYGTEPNLPNNTYRISWEKSKGWKYLWVWNCETVNIPKSEDNNKIPSSMSGSYRGNDGIIYNYFDFTPTNPTAENFWFNVIFKKYSDYNNWNDSSSEISIYKALFGTDRKYHLQ